jgi:hypothetical protein
LASRKGYDDALMLNGEGMENAACSGMGDGLLLHIG